MTQPPVYDRGNTSFEREWVHHFGRRRLSLFERAIHDPDLVSLRHELAKIDLRIDELETRAAEGETSRTWKSVRSLAVAISRLLDPSKTQDIEGARAKATELLELTTGPADHDALWDDILPLIQERRKLSATERKYEELHKVLIPATQLTFIFDDLHAAIEAIINDAGVQAALLREVLRRFEARRLTGRHAAPMQLPSAYDSAATIPVEEVSILDDEAVDALPGDGTVVASEGASEATPRDAEAVDGGAAEDRPGDPRVEPDGV